MRQANVSREICSQQESQQPQLEQMILAVKNDLTTMSICKFDARNKKSQTNHKQTEKTQPDRAQAFEEYLYSFLFFF